MRVVGFLAFPCLAPSEFSAEADCSGVCEPEASMPGLSKACALTWQRFRLVGGYDARARSLLCTEVAHPTGFELVNHLHIREA